MISKALLSAVAIALTFIAFYPYIQSIRRGQTKPHIFSWVVWSLTTFIVFLAQLQDHGGAGAWPIGVSGIITMYVALIAFVKRTDIAITKVDWMFLLMALASLPFWYFTADPLWAVILLTAVDVIGFGPTLRKAYFFPFEEHLTFFALFMGRNVIAIMALENYSLTTILFPAAISLACLLLILIVAYRRRVLSADL